MAVLHDPLEPFGEDAVVHRRHALTEANITVQHKTLTDVKGSRLRMVSLVSWRVMVTTCQFVQAAWLVVVTLGRNKVG